MAKLLKESFTYLCLTWLLLIGSIELLAQNSAGVAFLQMTAGSRAQAMGDAYTAIANSANGIHYNPAGMGFGLSRELMLFHAKWFQDISMENITFLFPFTSRLSISSSVSYLHMPEFTRYEVDPAGGGPLENGTFSVYDLVFSTGIGFRITDNIALGTNLKYFQERLESVSAAGIAFDLGILSKLPNTGLRIGFAIQHLGPSVQYIEKKEKLPLTYRAGLAYQFSNFGGLLAFDVAKTVGQDIQYLPGVELGFGSNFYLRGGYQVAEHEGSGLAAGFGLRLPQDHKINYVYAPYGDLGDTHRAELILHLGSAPVAWPAYQSSRSQKTSTDRAKNILNDSPLPETIKAVKPKIKTKTEPMPVAASAVGVLLPPQGIKLAKLENEMMRLSWHAVPVRNVGYHIYVKPSGGKKWIKITPKPVNETQQVFAQKKSNLNLLFVVTAVQGNRESDFSKPVLLEMP